MASDDAEQVGRGQISRGDAKILPLALPLLPKSGLSILRRSEIPLCPRGLSDSCLASMLPTEICALCLGEANSISQRGAG